MRAKVMYQSCSYAGQRVHVYGGRLYIWWLYAMVASYFFALPLMRIQHITKTDFRLYDLMFFIGIPIVLLPNISAIKTTIRVTPWIQAYMRFSALCALSLFVTWYLGGEMRAFIAAGRLIRFCFYGLVAAALVTFVRRKKELSNFIWMFFILIVLQACLSTLQSLGFLGQLWPSYWVQNYENIPVGTLGLHHLHIGTICTIGTSIGLFLMLNTRNKMILFFIALGISAMVYSTFAVRSRSGWVGIIIVVIMFLLSILLRKKNLAGLNIVSWILIGLICFNWLGGESISENVEENWSKGFEKRYESKGLSSLSPTRIDILKRLPDIIIEKPWVLVCGTGIQNSVKAINISNAAHNNYMHVLIETGILGLWLYISILLAMWRRLHFLLSNKIDRFGESVALGFRGAFFAILVLNFFNENFYMQYSTFSLTGQIMALAALTLHPLWTRSNHRSAGLK